MRASTSSSAGFAATRPDLLVMFVNDHLQNFPYSNMPAFCIGLCDDYDAPSPGSSAFMKIPARKLRGVPALGMALLEAGSKAASTSRTRTRSTAGTKLAVPLHFLLPDGALPVLPIYTNCAAPPLPTARAATRWAGSSASSFARALA
jgi:2,3-dihydroxyphenylpropionate 1,2-dioxygenase